jgi:hypothetical protein
VTADAVVVWQHDGGSHRSIPRDALLNSVTTGPPRICEMPPMPLGSIRHSAKYFLAGYTFRILVRRHARYMVSFANATVPLSFVDNVRSFNVRRRRLLAPYMCPRRILSSVW